jgi:hypothetical protein
MCIRVVTVLHITQFVILLPTPFIRLQIPALELAPLSLEQFRRLSAVYVRKTSTESHNTFSSQTVDHYFQAHMFNAPKPRYQLTIAARE